MHMWSWSVPCLEFHSLNLLFVDLFNLQACASEDVLATVFHQLKLNSYIYLIGTKDVGGYVL